MTMQVISGATEPTRARVRPVAGQTQATGIQREQVVPLTMPSSQEYYWRQCWQQGERASLAELEAGHGIVFDSDDPEDIVRWLHEPDGPDAD